MTMSIMGCQTSLLNVILQNASMQYVILLCFVPLNDVVRDFKSYIDKFV